MWNFIWGPDIEYTPVVTKEVLKSNVMGELLKKIKENDGGLNKLSKKKRVVKFEIDHITPSYVNELSNFKISDMKKPKHIEKIVKENVVALELSKIRTKILKSSYVKMCKFSPNTLTNTDFSDWVKRQIELFNELDNDDKLYFLMILVDRVISRIELTKNPEHYKKIKELVDRFLPELKTSNFAENFIKARLDYNK